MKLIDVFYQGEGIKSIDHLEIANDGTFSALRALLTEKHKLANNILIFIEDCDEPVRDDACLCEHAGAGGIKVHVHRCRQVEVAVTFNGETVHHRFGPGTTVAHVRKWAAEHKFHMTPEEAGEHVLQIAGTDDRPTPGTHLGSLATCPKCHLKFDLVPDQRVNGGPGWGQNDVAA